jgi:hypothetical protein
MLLHVPPGIKYFHIATHFVKLPVYKSHIDQVDPEVFVCLTILRLYVRLFRVVLAVKGEVGRVLN